MLLILLNQVLVTQGSKERKNPKHNSAITRFSRRLTVLLSTQSTEEKIERILTTDNENRIVLQHGNITEISHCRESKILKTKCREDRSKKSVAF